MVLRSPRAFPPGHPTTLICLELLQESLAARPAPRLLDVGCGCGVLLLAGAALGAGFCLGVDLSRQAVRLSHENAGENGLSGVVRLVQGSTECLRGCFDLILANLPWAVQLNKVAELTRLAAAPGTLILSGFRDTQESALMAGYRERGWSMQGRFTREEWAIEPPPEKSYTWVGWLLRGQNT